MPELPEVETVCKNLNQIIPVKSKILNWKFWRKDLRFQIPIKDLEKSKSEKLQNICRRAKYIVFEFENHLMISHLGMTGQWRLENVDIQKFKTEKHDHVGFEFQKNHWLIYNDPRRFGFIHFVKINDQLNYFSKMGIEPVDLKIDLNILTPVFKKIKTNIKSALMNQKYIVGVGNIYASEALFLAGILPTKPCSKVTEVQYQKIWMHTRAILIQAIESGGSTIKNYKNTNNEPGQFQNQLFVYGKEDQSCSVCRANNLVTRIKNIKIQGRSTFYCRICQK